MLPAVSAMIVHIPRLHSSYWSIVRNVAVALPNIRHVQHVVAFSAQVLLPGFGKQGHHKDHHALPVHRIVSTPRLPPYHSWHVRPHTAQPSGRDMAVPAAADMSARLPDAAAAHGGNRFKLPPLQMARVGDDFV
jgi:hypothetical protein